MVYVQLAQGWTDGTGASRAAGEMVDVDAGTLAELESRGIVSAPGEVQAMAWVGPGSPPADGDGDGTGGGAGGGGAGSPAGGAADDEREKPVRTKGWVGPGD
ncbi:MAG TPA: hypothetical protein VES42_21950 [Pilimelia sp.]|nr:hypothetical protein [Pilimelia sp.]